MNDGPYVNYWYLNFKNDITGIKEIREAMNIGFNRQGIVDDLARGSQKVANGIIPPGCNAYSADFAGFKYDPERAKALVAEAGFPDGANVTFRVSEYGQYGDAVVARMQQEWGEVGINLELEKMEWVTYMHAWASGLPPEHGGLQLGWGMSADYWLQLISHSKFQSPNGTNSGSTATRRLMTSSTRQRRSWTTPSGTTSISRRRRSSCTRTSPTSQSPSTARHWPSPHACKGS
jgi:peptide/nickel transport system substrate-binding protein